MPKANPGTVTDAAANASEKVKVRVLTQCVHGAANSIAQLDAGQLDEAKDAGLVDDNPTAVAYAESLTGQASGDGALTA